MLDTFYIMISHRNNRSFLEMQPGLVATPKVQLIFTFTFTFMHLADAFIQSDLHCIQVTVFTFYQLLLSLGIEPMILALLVPCSTSWATGKLDIMILIINDINGTQAIIYGGWSINGYSFSLFQELLSLINNRASGWSTARLISPLLNHRDSFHTPVLAYLMDRTSSVSHILSSAFRP